MNSIDDLHTLKRLLAEFELPVSPILEYAIENKEEELMESLSKKQTAFSNKEEAVNIMSDNTEDIKAAKKALSILRIYREDGTLIEGVKTSDVMVKAIKEIGARKVFELKIPLDGMHLVTIGGNPLYPSAQHEVGNGLFLNVHSNTKTKKRQLERIFNALHINWRVEIVE